MAAVLDVWDDSFEVEEEPRISLSMLLYESDISESGGGGRRGRGSVIPCLRRMVLPTSFRQLFLVLVDGRANLFGVQFVEQVRLL
jgi:hypothetical protein